MGPIMVFDFGLDEPSVTCPQPRGIFDGQHRARAAARLLSSDEFAIVDGTEEELAAVKGAPSAGGGSGGGASGGGGGGGGFDDFPLVVEVYPVRAEADVKRLYLEVNKGES
eukprot:4211817-Prymnesium_polylepis.2